MRRKAYGSKAAKPRPFTAFAAKDGQVGVRIAASKPFLRGTELIVSAAPIRVTAVDGGLRITGEGVVRRHASTIAIAA